MEGGIRASLVCLVPFGGNLGGVVMPRYRDAAMIDGDT